MKRDDKYSTFDEFVADITILEKIWVVFRTVCIALLGVVFLILLTSCGTDHTVKGGTENNAEATLEVIKKCDRVAINVCKEVAAEDKLECVKYACEISGSIEVLGVSEENLGDIIDQIDGEESL